MKEKENNSGKNDVYGRARLILLGLLLFSAIAPLFRKMDNDIWFLFSHGRYVLESGFPSIEPFSLHEGLKFMIQQWLSAVIFYLDYLVFGEFGVRLLVSLCYGGSILLFHKLSMKVSRQYFAVSYVASALFAVLLFFFMTSRPYIFTTPIILLELLVLEEYFRKGRRRILLYLPLLSLLLINLQAAMWPMAFVVLLPYMINTLPLRIGRFRGRRMALLPLPLTALLMFLAGLINPYGSQAMTYLFRSYGISEISVMVNEMKAANIQTVIGVTIFLTITLLGLSFIRYKKRDIPVRYLLLFLGMAYLSLSAIRGLLFLAICGIFPLAFLYRNVRIPEFGKANPFKIRKSLVVLAVLVVLAAVGLSALRSAPTSAYYKDLNQAVDLILKDREAREVVAYTSYNEGGLCQYRGLKTYLDARAEVYVKKNNGRKDILKEFYNLQVGDLHYKEFVDVYGFTHFILKENDLLRTYLAADEDYELILENDSYLVYRVRSFAGDGV